MQWYETNLSVPCKACDIVSEMLISLGAGGTVIGNEDDSNITVKAYFPDSLYLEVLKSEIEDRMQRIQEYISGEWCLEISTINQEDWAEGFKKHFRPFFLTDSIVIRPTWHDYKVCGNEKVIVLDPGMAFGTGLHETTRMCASLMEMHLKRGDRFADIGCGSGILSLIAVLLGASRVDAVDIDEAAVEAARQNLRHNDAQACVKKGGIECLNGIYDIIAANITADVLTGMPAMISRFTDKGGKVILSGIIRDREHDVENSFCRPGFVSAGRMTMGEWVAMVFIWEGSS